MLEVKRLAQCLWLCLNGLRHNILWKEVEEVKLIGKIVCRFTHHLFSSSDKAPIIERWKVGEGKVMVYRCVRCDAELWRAYYER